MWRVAVGARTGYLSGPRWCTHTVYVLYVKITVHICSEDNFCLTSGWLTSYLRLRLTHEDNSKTQNPPWLALTVPGASVVTELAVLACQA